MRRKRYIFGGQVQGVGFRPFVFRLANDFGLSGFVENGPQGVIVEVQGQAAKLDCFKAALYSQLPPLANISACCEEDAALEAVADFQIRPSRSGEGGHAVLVSPDVAVCGNCLADLQEPGNRRQGYAFTNCTDCGPRFSITRSIPYDRPVTSMGCFPLCPECLAEYENPLDRRFHAQPNACPRCGPELWLEYAPDFALRDQFPRPEQWTAILDCLRAIRRGALAAIKGLGGFHLACDAFAAQAIQLLRLRKRRPHKALAVMVPDLDAARRYAWFDQSAEQALQSRTRPIVICPRKPGGLPASLSPDSQTIGLILPYTPLHYLLFRPDLLGGELDEAPKALVMTSGNFGGQPICLGNREARQKLAGIADVFLLHNRDILVRVDDSVILAGSPAEADIAETPAIFLRRARGYVPEAQELPVARLDCVLAVGAELKHTFCLTRKKQAFVSQHIGDLHQTANLDFFRESLAHLTRLLEVKAQAVIADLHPDYLSSQAAAEYAAEHQVPLLRLQHHFAHVYALMAEHGLDEPVLGLALDGSGLGTDGTIWGGELLLVRPGPNKDEQVRLGRLRPFALPGGEAAIRAPWRIAESLIQTVDPGSVRRPWAVRPERAKLIDPLREMIARRSNSPFTSSCGRLFDALAALCGLCFEISHEGQAAVLLEQAQNLEENSAYRTEYGLAESDGIPLLELDSYALFGLAALDLRRGVSPGRVARRFHLGLSRGLAEMAVQAAQSQGVRKIVLAGGVLNNRTLTGQLRNDLRGHGLAVFLPEKFPAGDGAISLGQAYYAVRHGLPQPDPHF